MGLDSLSYHLSEDVNKVELIVHLESGDEYIYNASLILIFCIDLIDLIHKMY